MNMSSQSSATPYPPSWLNRFLNWVARLPGPSWLYALIVWLSVFGITTLIAWNGGEYPTGTFDIFHFIFTGSLVAAPLLMRYLNKAAARAMENSRSVLDVSAEQFSTLCYEFTTLPARATFFWSLLPALTIVLNLFYSSANGLEGLRVSSSPLLVGWAIIFAILWSIFVGPMIYQVLRYIRLVNRIYKFYTRVDLYNLSPLYGFSALMLRASIALILITAVIYASAPQLLDDTLSVANAIFSVLFAGAVFILPLLGMHNRLVDEKERVLGETAQRIQVTIAALHQTVDTTQWKQATDFREALAALEIEQRLLEKIPTWPWQPETIRIIITALILPIAIFLIQFVIQKFLAP